MATGDQAGEGEVVPLLLAPPALEDLLHPLPQIVRDDRFVLAPVRLAAEVEIARVDPVVEDLLNRRLRHRVAALPKDHAGRFGHFGHVGQRVLAGRVPLEEVPDDRGDHGVRDDRARP